MAFFRLQAHARTFYLHLPLIELKADTFEAFKTTSSSFYNRQSPIGYRGDEMIATTMAKTIGGL